MKYLYADFIKDCISTNSLFLVTAVGYCKLKAVCLDNINNSSDSEKSIETLPYDELAKLTGIESDKLKQMYKSIEYRFKIIIANGWDHP
jgi:hypothetical protein